MFRSCYVPYRRTEDDIEEDNRRSKVEEAQMSPNRQTESMFSEDFCVRNWVGLPKTNRSSPNEGFVQAQTEPSLTASPSRKRIFFFFFLKKQITSITTFF